MKGSSGAASGPPLSALTRRSLLTGAGGVVVAAPAIVRAQGLSKRRVAVIGAGVFGTWTAEHLRRAGHAVTLIDAFSPAHSRASSGGESRMTRAGYGKDEIYSRMARDSLVEWKALSSRSGLPIFVEHGVLFFTSKPDSYFADSVAVSRKIGLPIVEMTRATMAQRFQMIDFAGVETGFLEPGFGALMARRAVQTLARQLTDKGVIRRTMAAASIRTNGRTADAVISKLGETIQADLFVFALGPWLPKLFPELLGGRIVATRQEVFYFGTPAGDLMFQPGMMPGWADFNGGDVYYGFPDLEGKGVKFAHDTHGIEVDPDTHSRQYSAAALANVVAFRDRRFPGLRGAPLIGSEVCQYENSSNGDFLIDRHPTMSNVILVGGGSGHGFKHGPEVGRLAAAIVLSSGPQTEPRFTLATKATKQAREVH
ncbi:FAD-dependent oxidoreductase [Sphingomonas sp.]|uniref:FAD-dependent oxidoreductase n=1 Tax=Sphingomonas sp. TaxID=28214 RepID=UPI00286B944E|nr:FAD-dependent oxidoreductase [Sphingomonas sp.]